MSHPASDARQKVLNAAERLFMQHGYTAVTVKDIAREAGIHHASLYHHAPNGKEDLFSEVMERALSKHGQGIAAAIAEGKTLREQLEAIAAWLVGQPPIDMIRLVHSDSMAISPAASTHLITLAYQTLLVPIERIFYEAVERREIRPIEVGVVAGGWFSAIQGLHMLPDPYLILPRLAMAQTLNAVFLSGIQPE